MKIKSFFIILFLISVMLLSGCAGVVTPATDEAKVKSVIQNYYLAINDQNWNKAKNLCVYESDQYYKVSIMEDAFTTLQQYYETVTINCFVNISNVSVMGSYASAYINVTVVITIDYYYDTDSDSGYLYLQKIGNNWKLY